MASEYVPKRLRTEIAKRANGLCEYCLTPVAFSTAPFVAEHIHPLAKGGLTILDNLAYACIGCNGYKQDRTEIYDTVSQAMTPFYNPRQDFWHDHFEWNEEFTHLIPLTAIGRVTLSELHLNRDGVINIRLLLILAGLHPPQL